MRRYIMGSDGSIGKIEGGLRSIRQDLIPTEAEGRSFGHTFKALKNSIIQWSKYAKTGVKVSKEDTAFHKINKLLVQIEGHINTAKPGDIEILSRQLESIQEICKYVRENKKEKIDEGKIQQIGNVEEKVKGLDEQLELKKKSLDEQRETIKRGSLGAKFKQILYDISIRFGNLNKDEKEWTQNKKELSSISDKIKDPKEESNYIQLSKQAKGYIRTLYKIANQELRPDIFKDIDLLLPDQKEEILPETVEENQPEQVEEIQPEQVKEREDENTVKSKIEELQKQIKFEKGQLEILEKNVKEAEYNLGNNVGRERIHRLILQNAPPAIANYKKNIIKYENEIKQLKGKTINDLSE